MYLCGRETMVLYRDCFDGGGACWMRGWTPPACGHPLSEGDDLTPALSTRRGSGLPRREAAPPLTTSNLRFQRGKPDGREGGDEDSPGLRPPPHRGGRD